MNSVANLRLSAAHDVTPVTGRGLRLSPVPIERFDEYVVVARLGHGGMAEVILGMVQGPQGFRKLIAIKRLHAHCEEDPELVRMFLHEASLSALLAHPNVVQTHKVGCADRRHFMAMEYLEGQPLHRALPRLCRANGGLDPVLAARIAADALSGLQHAHEACDYTGAPLGLVHRDVSPQNLFVTYEGQVKVLDFGIAKAAASAASTHTRPGLIKGKLAYIAPEQARGQVDRRADLWSVGVVLWEMLTGSRLFRGDDEVSTLRAVLSADIPPVRAVCPELPEALGRVVARALQRDRGERYSSAREMKDELEAWLYTQDRNAARGVLAQAMQGRFADTIRERRAAVLECLAAVDHEQRWREVSSAAATDPGLPSLEVARTPARRMGLKWALAALTLLVGGSVFALASPRPEAAQIARTSPPPRATDERPAAVAAEPVAPERPQAAAPRAAETAPASAGRVAPTPAVAVAPAIVAADAPESAPTRFHGAAHGTAKRGVRAVTSSAASEAVLAPAHRPSADPTAPHAPRAAEPTAVATGRLRLSATPYAVVSLDGRRLGITPIDVELPATAHTLTLRNPERNIETTYRVQIVAGESLSRRLELE